jgi:hypothetical protein
MRIMSTTRLAILAFSLCLEYAAIAQQGTPDTATTAPGPVWSPAQNIGLFAFPKDNQNADQQLKDEAECYGAARQRTGIDAQAPPPQGLSEEEKKAAQMQAAANAPQVQGVRVAGARGAAGGAAIGAIAANAGKGAAIGAVAGTMQGGAAQRSANAQSQQQAAAKAAAAQKKAEEECYASTRRE